MDTEKLAEGMKALSSEARIGILVLLRERPLCAGGIAHRLQLSPSAASQHLRVLREAGLVQDCRRGNHVHYSLIAGRLEELSALLKDLTSGEVMTGCNRKKSACRKLNSEKGS